MDKRFLYEVRPHRQIVIPGKPAQKRAFSALLTINEVKEYMQYGPVFRKYADANIPMVQVTGSNIYNLHQEYSAKKANKRPVVEAPVDNAPTEVEADTTVTVDEPVVEESELKKSKEEEFTSTIETVVEEDIVEEATSDDNETNDDIIETENIDIQENVSDDANVDELEVEEVVESEEDVVEESVSEELEIEEESEPEVEEEETSEGTDDQVEQEEDAADDTVEDDSQSENTMKSNTYNTGNIQFSTNKKHHK